LKPLTLLTGFNAAGKSTALQTLLLLAQTQRAQKGAQELVLNGQLISLGTPSDVIRSGGIGNALKLGGRSGDVELVWSYTLDENRRSLRVTDLRENGTTLFDAFSSRRFPSETSFQFTQEIEQTVFLGAARKTDAEVFPIPDMTAPRGDVGPLGQYAPWWLYSEGDSPVQLGRRHRQALNAATLRQQINVWSDTLFPGAEVNALPVERTSLVRLQLRVGRTSDWSSPANIGYGISYAFPILVAGLCATEGGPIVLDSPEAHLHPQGQSGIGRFLAQMASAGAQILVETHSDHLLNGVRVALRDGIIRPEDVAIYFFSTRSPSAVTRLSVDQKGAINDWPEGFFDQAEKDLASLAGWTR
jgi:Protein of unknown function (DUF3696)/AAA ATPase domain